MCLLVSEVLYRPVPRICGETVEICDACVVQGRYHFPEINSCQECVLQKLLELIIYSKFSVKACVMGFSAWTLLTIGSSISSACTDERSLFIYYTQFATVKCFIVYLYQYKLGHQLSWLTGLCCFQVVFINLVSCLFSTDRTLRLSGWYSCFVFGKSRVQISTRRPLC
jgi:hypothetical protein